jgi:hypothetical protein
VLVPCRTYTIRLPSGHGRQVSVAAYGGGGSQSARLTY